VSRVSGRSALMYETVFAVGLPGAVSMFSSVVSMVDHQCGCSSRREGKANW